MEVRKKVKIKICGITSTDDAYLAKEAGADYIGLIIDIAFSLRCISLEKARHICEKSPLPVVAVVLDREASEIANLVGTLYPYAVQLAGQEPPSLVRALKGLVNCEIWKSIFVPAHNAGEIDIISIQNHVASFVDAGVDVILFDTAATNKGQRQFGGTGVVSNWEVARELSARIPIQTFLAGGINPDNVQEAIRKVCPDGVDLASGVEASPGKKDPDKIYRLVEKVRSVSP